MIKNKNILITGASSGIGADLLKMLAPFNKVIAVARNIDKIYKHENVKPMVCDISKVVLWLRKNRGNCSTLNSKAAEKANLQKSVVLK